jgi:predicted glycosyltransferase
MLKEEVFNRVAKEYGTSIGVAKIFKMQPLTEYKEEIKDDLVFDKYKKELQINYIIVDAVDLGLYKELQMTIWDIKTKRKSKIQDDLRLYRKAFKEITKDLDYIDEY